MSGRRQTETTNQNFQNQENINTGPWGPQQPYVQRLFREADMLMNQGPLQYFPGQTYVDPSQYSLQGIQAMANLGNVQNDPLYGLASNFIGSSLGSTPQIGNIQSFLNAQLDPNTQMRPPVPGYAPPQHGGGMQGGGPIIPGGGGMRQVGQTIPGMGGNAMDALSRLRASGAGRLGPIPGGGMTTGGGISKEPGFKPMPKPGANQNSPVAAMLRAIMGGGR